MNDMIFCVKSRVDRPVMRIIHAKMRSPCCEITVYLDNETGKPMYPITTKPLSSGITLELVSDTEEVCALPPFVSGKSVNGIIRHLEQFDNLVLAARALIKEEQERFGK